jgi:hypothetical protein
MDDELDPGIRFLIDEVGFDQDPDLPISNQALLQLAMQAARLEEAKRIDRAGETGGGVSFDLDGPAATGLASRVDWDSDHSGWSGLLSKDGKVRAGGNFADFLSRVLDEDDTTAKKGENTEDPVTLDSRFVIKDKANKGWFDL